MSKNINNGILKFADKPMGMDMNLFPEVSSNMVTPDLSILVRPRPKINLKLAKKALEKTNMGRYQL